MTYPECLIDNRINVSPYAKYPPNLGMWWEVGDSIHQGVLQMSIGFELSANICLTELCLEWVAMFPLDKLLYSFWRPRWDLYNGNFLGWISAVLHQSSFSSKDFVICGCFMHSILRHLLVMAGRGILSFGNCDFKGVTKEDGDHAKLDCNSRSYRNAKREH